MYNILPLKYDIYMYTPETKGYIIIYKDNDSTPTIEGCSIY